MNLEIFLEKTRGQLDWRVFDDMKREETNPTYMTYYNFDEWISLLFREAVRLDLHTAKPLDILDLGTGPGHFPYICRLLGHRVLGLERPRSKLWPFHAWMRVPVIAHGIAARLPFPALPLRFDLVTSFRVPFNNKKGETGEDGRRELFDLDEWTFFLDDLRDNVLKPGGTFHMKMNTQSDHIGLRYGSPELMEYFAGRGADLGERKPYVTFAPLK